MSFYRSSPAAARRYLEADRSRADDYYLTEGTGVAERFSASPDTGVRYLGSLSGEGYEAWVAGLDPHTGLPKGRLRTDENAVRFAEVVVNGPKSWSLAAALHPDISRAYDAAQERAAAQIIGWLAAHATTRVGPRGAQVQVPVAGIEAVTVRHYTSRAGDPHRHLHLQLNARVRAEGRWYALHTVGVRDSLGAINGIGHAAVLTDPGFRAALSAHGFTLDPVSGEITQLGDYVGAFSQRAAQIEANLDRYEARWRHAHPGAEPGPGLRRRWDHQAWNDARPGKITPRDGAELSAAWITELRALGYRDPAGPVLDTSIRPGQVDRDRAVRTVLARLGARRSAWNTADVRGEVEQHLAREGLIADAAARLELAEDLTARTLTRCVPLVDRPGLPEHLRALTSTRVLNVEADIVARLIDRAETRDAPAAHLDDAAADSLKELDRAQRRVAAVLAGDAQLVVVEGAAGAGKTATLAAARTVVEARGHRLVVVTPTRKAAQIAATQLDTPAWSAAWLAHQHGWRWTSHGTWTRLTPGDLDRDGRNGHGRTRQYTGPTVEAQLHPGDVVVVDEAGMLDQDTARALLRLADDNNARLVLVGDRHQLPAVGRGGVLDLAVRHVPPEASLELSAVHRFSDPDYARLTLAMRTGEDPAATFDALLDKGLVRVYGSQVERVDALADDTTTALMSGRGVRVVADTNQQTVQLNTAIRDRLVTTGAVDDRRVVTTRAGQRIGVGDLVVTRRNDRDLGVANRDGWSVTRISRHGDLTITPANAGSGGRGGARRTLPNDYVRQHLQLGYASTVHSAQGETVDSCQLVLGEHTGAANAYVGMTRGKDSNTVHLVAASVDEAREQWVETFSRDRADLGPAVAARRVSIEANRYAPQRPLADALTDLWTAWTVEADTHAHLDTAMARRDRLTAFLTAHAEYRSRLGPVGQARLDARAAADTARQYVDALTRQRGVDAARLAGQLHAQWRAERDAARHAAQIVQAGPGPLHVHHRAVRQALDELTRWAERWRPVLGLPTNPHSLADWAAAEDDTTRIGESITRHAHTRTVQAHPEIDTATRAVQRAHAAARAAEQNYQQTAGQLRHQLLDRFGSLAYAIDTDQQLHHAELQVEDLASRQTAARDRVASLLTEPALRTQPPDRIREERDRWQHQRDTDAHDRATHAAAARLAAEAHTQAARTHHRDTPHHPMQPPTPSRGISI